MATGSASRAFEVASESYARTSTCSPATRATRPCVDAERPPGQGRSAFPCTRHANCASQVTSCARPPRCSRSRCSPSPPLAQSPPPPPAAVPSGTARRLDVGGPGRRPSAARGERPDAGTGSGPQRILASWREAVTFLRARSTDLRISMDQVLQAEAQTRDRPRAVPAVDHGHRQPCTHQLITRPALGGGAFGGVSIGPNGIVQSSRIAHSNTYSRAAFSSRRTIINNVQGVLIRSASTNLGEDASRLSVDGEKRTRRAQRREPDRRRRHRRTRSRDQPRRSSSRARASGDHGPQAGPGGRQRFGRRPRPAERRQRASLSRHRRRVAS